MNNCTPKIIPIPFSRWHWRSLLFCHLFATFLLVTLFTPGIQNFWHAIDVSFFKTINNTLRHHPSWQLFWACANHKWADWVEDLCILGFFIAHVQQAPKHLRSRKIAELIVCVLSIALILYCVNRVLFRETWTIPRLSPTLVVDNSVRLSHEIPWMSIKDDSSKSFPGDHATTAILFAAMFFYLTPRRLGCLAACYAGFLCLPRLITGAHWLSDVLVGSGAIALVSLSWIFCSPAFQRSVDCIEALWKRVRP